MSTEYQIPVEIEKMLKVLEDSGEVGDVDRGLLAEELVKRFKETKSSLPQYGIYPEQFEFDGYMIINCGDKRQWDIFVWCDGVVEPATYSGGSIYDPVSGVSLRDALLNPQLVMVQLVDLIGSLCDQISFETDLDVGFEDLEYDAKNENWYVKG